MQTHPDPSQEPKPAMPLLVAAHLQDHLMSASNDLERLQRLLADACDVLMSRFHGAVSNVRGLMAAPDGQVPPADAEALKRVMDDLGVAVTALQFQDMASQLIHHTHLRLRSVADQLARDAFGDDPEGAAIVSEAPLRPNPVTQDEMDAGSVELF
jgi:hypothetical protein